MRVIAVVSQKGGCGKSTIVRTLAVEAAERDLRVRVADLDLMQGTVTQWNMRRQLAGRTPTIEVQTYSNVDQARRATEGIDLLLFDGAPHASVQTSQASKGAQLTVIPTKTTLDDLAAALALARELVKAGVEPERVLFVLNQTTDSVVEVSEARQWLLRGGFPTCEAAIALKTGYSRALDQGDALQEARHPSLSGRAQMVANEIFDYLDAVA